MFSFYWHSRVHWLIFLLFTRYLKSWPWVKMMCLVIIEHKLMYSPLPSASQFEVTQKAFSTPGLASSFDQYLHCPSMVWTFTSLVNLWSRKMCEFHYGKRNLKHLIKCILKRIYLTILFFHHGVKFGSKSAMFRNTQRTKGLLQKMSISPKFFSLVEKQNGGCYTLRDSWTHRATTSRT